MLPQHLEACFPKLKADGATKTSEATNQYNCIAWSAACDIRHWWEPEKLEPWYYWPPDLPPNDYAFENFIRLFQNIGYKKHSNPTFEIFYEKVALYAIYGSIEPNKWGFAHVCHQLHSGAWSSKLGPAEDIQHNSVESLEGDASEYGHVRIILKRRCNLAGILKRAFFKFISNRWNPAP